MKPVNNYNKHVLLISFTFRNSGVRASKCMPLGRFHGVIYKTNGRIIRI
jgi:hypothetical protein